MQQEAEVARTERPFILIVDDEVELAQTVAYNLQNEGYRVGVAHTAAEALERLDTPPAPDALLLDWMLPDMPGTEICQRVRRNPATSHLPVVMITARNDEIDRVVGFELGADDYVTKPFSVRELSLRVRAVLRRVRTPKEPERIKELSYGCLRVDPAAHHVWVSELEIKLTALEFKLLTTLMSRSGRVQTRSTLLEDVWEVQGDVATRTVDTHVKRLREKLGDAGSYVETIRGVGYRFQNEANTAA